MLFFTVFVLSLYSDTIIFSFISILPFFSVFNLSPSNAFNQFISQYHIIIPYSKYLRFLLFPKYELYSIFQINSIFDLSSQGKYVSFILKFWFIAIFICYISHIKFNIQFWCFLHINISPFLIYRYIYNLFIFNLSPMCVEYIFISQYQIC